LRRRYLIVFGCLLLALLLGGGYLYLMPPAYTASTTMMIETRNNHLLQQTLLGDSPPDSGWIESQIGVLNGVVLANEVQRRLRQGEAQDVAVLDLDVDLGDVFAYFGKEPKRSLAEVSAEVARGARPDEMVELGMQLAKHVIGFGSPQDPGATAITPEATAELVRTLRSAFAYTVVDATCDYTDHVIQALELSDDVLFVTGLDVISVRHLSLGMRTLEDLGVSRDRMRVVLNRADSKVELSAGDIEDALGLKIDALIPSSALVPRSVNRSELLWFSERRSPVAKGIADLADRIRQGSERPTAVPHRRARHIGGRHQQGGDR
jgi:pilus assembly protein CpaE